MSSIQLHPNYSGLDSLSDPVIFESTVKTICDTIGTGFCLKFSINVQSLSDAHASFCRHFSANSSKLGMLDVLNIYCAALRNFGEFGARKRFRFGGMHPIHLPIMEHMLKIPNHYVALISSLAVMKADIGIEVSKCKLELSDLREITESFASDQNLMMFDHPKLFRCRKVLELTDDLRNY